MALLSTRTHTQRVHTLPHTQAHASRCAWYVYAGCCVRKGEKEAAWGWVQLGCMTVSKMAGSKMAVPVLYHTRVPIDGVGVLTFSSLDVLRTLCVAPGANRVEVGLPADRATRACTRCSHTHRASSSSPNARPKPQPQRTIEHQTAGKQCKIFRRCRQLGPPPPPWRRQRPERKSPAAQRERQQLRSRLLLHRKARCRRASFRGKRR